MKLRLSFGSKPSKFVVPSPIKEKPVDVDRPISDAGFKSQLSPITNFRDFGSKEENFFDSQPWLESDCDDDFVSVNGDFTPSCGNTPDRGNTPVHNFSTENPRVNKSLFLDRMPGSHPEPSPTSKKKLADLFRDSIKEEQVADEQNSSGDQIMSNGRKSEATATPYISGANSVCSSEMTPYGDSKPEKEKAMKSSQCCLPRLLSNRSYDGRKKKMSPAHG